MEDENEQGQEPGAEDTLREQAPDNSQVLAAVDEIRGMYQQLAGTITARELTDLKRQAGAIEARMRAAVESADTAAFDSAQRELSTLNGEMQKLATKPAQPAEDPSFVAFKRDNPWYEGDDPKHAAMTADADAIGQVAYRKGLRGAALYAHVGKAIKAKYASDFQNPRRQAPSAVEAGQGAARGAGPKKNGFAELPEEGKRAFSQLVRKGTFKDTPEEREAYAASAFAAMPLEVRNAA